jgi:hypothetical protein
MARLLPGEDYTYHRNTQKISRGAAIACGYRNADARLVFCGQCAGADIRTAVFVRKEPPKVRSEVTVAEHKQEETFKVVDRRLFTESGELRKEVVEQHNREEEAAKKAVPPAGPPQAKNARVQTAEAPSPVSPDQADANAIQPSRNFQMLVDFLTRNAAAMLGGVADPRTGQAFLDLEGAREMIDMLDALREKTRGNLAPADDDLLMEVLGSLKLTFMEVSKAAAEAMNKKPKAKG